MVDRYGPWVNADLAHSAVVQAAMAQLDQPLRRGHDDLCGSLRGHVPADPRGPSVAGVLDAAAAPEHERVAAVPLSPGVGRVRGVDLRNHFRGLLVFGNDSRFWNVSRPRGFQV